GGRPHRLFEELAGTVVRAQQRLHLRGDRGIDRLFSFEQAFPARRVEGDRFVEHRRDPLPVGTQAGVSSSFASQARATAQWRFTVAGEMPIASAVSSIERPPKKRSSTMRAWLASSAARRSSAESRAM